MMTSSNGNIFCVTGNLWAVNSPHKGQWRGALMFSLICVWINGWLNNREAGDSRRYRAHYYVTVMNIGCFSQIETNHSSTKFSYSLCFDEYRTNLEIMCISVVNLYAVYPPTQPLICIFVMHMALCRMLLRRLYFVFPFGWNSLH